MYQYKFSYVATTEVVLYENRSAFHKITSNTCNMIKTNVTDEAHECYWRVLCEECTTMSIKNVQLRHKNKSDVSMAEEHILAEDMRCLKKNLHLNRTEMRQNLSYLYNV